MPVLPFLFSVPSENTCLGIGTFFYSIFDTNLRSIESLSKKKSTQHCDELFSGFQKQIKPVILWISVFPSQKVQLPPSFESDAEIPSTQHLQSTQNKVLSQKPFNWTKVEKLMEKLAQDRHTDHNVSQVFLLDDTQLIKANISTKVTKMKI